MMINGGIRIGGLTLSNTYDADALAYLTAVEAADGQSLETSVKVAINTFVVGCKTDGIWNSIVASCIMAGARTVAGAIIPLLGNAPTNNNFVIGNYNRKTGLIGNDLNKYLATGYSTGDTTSFPQDNSHISCYVSASQTDGFGTFIGGATGSGNRLIIQHSLTTNILFRSRSNTSSTSALAPLGFQGSSRNNLADFIRRSTSSSGVSEATQIAVSGTPSSDLIGVFATGAGLSFTGARMSFYSIGKSLTLSSLDSRVTTLMNTFNTLL